MKQKLLTIVFVLLVGVLVSSGYAQDGPLAPDGESGQTYFAPFPVPITLDGDASDWQGVPRVFLSSGGTSVGFAAAADDTTLYLLADVTDPNIIAGQHATSYWNEDSVEFYLNGTGDLTRRSYGPGVAQLTIPALNIGLPIEEAIIAGIQGESVNAQTLVVATEGGYVVEVAVPLVNDVWTITPEHGATIGFQFHLNGASEMNRDTKLIWSIFDTNDQSYVNPSLFGYLLFYEVGQTDVPSLPESLGATTVERPPVPRSALYRASSMPTEVRVIDLLSRMTLEDKIAQMTLVEKGSIQPRDVQEFGIGGVLSGGGGSPSSNTPAAWAEMVDGYQQAALDAHFGIPLIYGVDAVHGHNNLFGATIFPHNIGLGATRNPALVEQICRATALETIATGIYWNYSPVVAVLQDIRWGRSYEVYGEDTALVTEMALACIRGLQGDDIRDPLTMLASVKHYVGDGGTAWGSSTTGDYQIDQGVTQVDEATLRAIHLPPYQAAVEAGAQNIMISFSSWNETKMHGQGYLINDVLKGEFGFEGFIVSDWGGVDQVVEGDYYQSVVESINAGVDMVMVPYNYLLFMETLKQAVNSGDVPLARIDDAVTRILTVKMNMGLFEHPFHNPDLVDTIGSAEHRALARQAAAESAVLLRNENAALPIDPATPTLLVAGSNADDLGNQMGGWTISWQGDSGKTTLGTTILAGIQATVGAETTVIYDAAGAFADDVHAEIGIVVVGETPYAEGLGDNGELTLSAEDLAAIEATRAHADKVVVVIVAGRPQIITDYVEAWDGVVMAWLPGSEGQGVADVLFGVQPFTGKLPVTWPTSVEQLPISAENAPLYAFGYGLTTE